MKLVPAAATNAAIQADQLARHNPYRYTLSHLDQLEAEIRELLENNSAADSKIERYYQLVNNYRNLNAKRFQPTVPPAGKPPLATVSRQTILEKIPITKRPAAQKLIQHIEQQENLGVGIDNRLYIDGVPIPNSNILDIIDNLSRDRKTVTAPGAKELLQAAVNLPNSAIGNRQLRKTTTPQQQSPSVATRLFSSRPVSSSRLGTPSATSTPIGSGRSALASRFATPQDTLKWQSS